MKTLKIKKVTLRDLDQPIWGDTRLCDISDCNTHCASCGPSYLKACCHAVMNDGEPVGVVAPALGW
jgi:hypothetical protein